MRTAYGNFAQNGSHVNGNNVANATPENEASGSVANYAEAARIGQECLKLREVKFWACELSVHQRSIQRWISGETQIPEKYLARIISVTKGYFEDLSRIEAAMDRMAYMHWRGQ